MREILDREIKLKRYYEVDLELTTKTWFEFETLESMARDMEKKKEDAERSKDVSMLRIQNTEKQDDGSILIQPEKPQFDVPKFPIPR